MSTPLNSALPADVMDVIKATAPVVAANVNTITETFYPRMFKNNPEVKAFFNMSNQRKKRQPMALANSVVASVGHINNLAEIRPALDLIGEKHCALGVLPEHYQIVHDNFMGAVGDVLGDAVTPEIANAWSKLVLHVAEACIYVEDGIYKDMTAQLEDWDARNAKEFVVDRVVDEANGFKSFYFKRADGKALPSYVPGQYLTIHVPFDDICAPRHYTISSNEPVDGCLRVTVRHESAGDYQGLASTYLHNSIAQGNSILIRPPFGCFTRNQDANSEVFFTAGSGLTPALAMVPDAVKAGSKVGHVHCHDSEANHPLKESFKGLDLSLEKHSYGTPDEIDVVALVDDVVKAGFDVSSTHFYACGPPSYVKDVRAALKNKGVDVAAAFSHELYGPAINFDE